MVRVTFVCHVAMFLVCLNLHIQNAHSRGGLRQMRSESAVVREKRAVAEYNFNSMQSVLGWVLSSLLTPPGGDHNQTEAVLEISVEMWETVFGFLQYLTFLAWFALLMCSYYSGVIILFIFQLVSQRPTLHGGYEYGMESLFRSFEDEQLSLFDKVTSLGYGVYDRTVELKELLTKKECMKLALCHGSSTLGDQEANGFAFKDVLRQITSNLDTKAGTEGLSRAVNLGLLTGECGSDGDMGCPELQPYFKRISDSFYNYL